MSGIASFVGRDALLRVRILLVLTSCIAMCGASFADKLTYSPKVPQYDGSLNSPWGTELDDSRFKDVEKDFQRSSDPKNIPSYGREDPEVAEMRRQWEQRWDEERKKRDEAERQKWLQRKRDEECRNSFLGIREQQEKEYLDGQLFPGITHSLEMIPLREKAKGLVQSIDWEDVEKIYNKLTQIIEGARMARGLSGKEGDVRKIREKLATELGDVCQMLLAYYLKYKEYAVSLEDGKSRNLFNSYFDEEASKVVPRTFTSTASRFIDSCSKALNELGDNLPVPRGLEFSKRYRMFMDDSCGKSADSKGVDGSCWCNCSNPEPEIMLTSVGGGWANCVKCKNLIGLVSKDENGEFTLQGKNTVAKDMAEKMLKESMQNRKVMKSSSSGKTSSSKGTSPSQGRAMTDEEVISLLR